MNGFDQGGQAVDRLRNKQPAQPEVRSLAQDALAIILAGGRGSSLAELIEWRAKPAAPFGGKFRIIDFALSNCVNSGIRRLYHQRLGGAALGAVLQRAYAKLL
jgi:hypothetical protein